MITLLGSVHARLACAVAAQERVGATLHVEPGQVLHSVDRRHTATWTRYSYKAPCLRLSSAASWLVAFGRGCDFRCVSRLELWRSPNPYPHGLRQTASLLYSIRTSPFDDNLAV